MVKKQKKLWAHYEQIKHLLGTYIALFFLVPFLSLCFSCLAHSAEIDSGVQDAVKSALLIGLKWYAIIMPIVTVLFIIRFLYNSDTVEFTDTSIKYYRWIFSKRSRSINFNKITECVISDGLWYHKKEYVHGRKIFLYNKGNIVLTLEIYSLFMLIFSLNLHESKVRVVNDNCNLSTISNYYKIDYNELSNEDKFKLCKHYCKAMKNKQRNGRIILEKFKKIFYLFA